MKALFLPLALLLLFAPAARATDDSHDGTLSCGLNTACLVTVPGTITATIVGDSANWAVETATPNTVTVRPAAAGLRTNLIVLTATDAFFVDLVAPNGDSHAAGTPRIAFAAKPSTSAAPMVQVLATPPPLPASPAPSAGAAVDPRPISIAYRWTTRRHPRITAVYDDGSKTYIRLRSDEAPALYALTPTGLEAVNYVVTAGTEPHELTYTADRTSPKWLLTLGGKGRHATNLLVEQIAVQARQSPAATATPAAATTPETPAEN